MKPFMWLLFSVKGYIKQELKSTHILGRGLTRSREVLFLEYLLEFSPQTFSLL